jgi:DHA1 family inner membrane transport protein
MTVYVRFLLGKSMWENVLNKVSISSKKLLIPALFAANSVIFIPQLINNVLLLEIGASFDVEVGIAGQMGTAVSMVSIIFALLMGVLSVRYSYKTLLFLGLGFLGIAAFGAFLAPSFWILFIMYAFTGISVAMVQPMSHALVGQQFSVETRPHVMGVLTVGGATAYLLGSPLLGFIGDWRLAFAVLLPLILSSMFLVLVGIPTARIRSRSSQKSFQGVISVVSNRSAMACIIATIFAFMAWGMVLTYGVSFYRQQFFLDSAFLSMIFIGYCLLYVLAGAVIVGKIVHRVGRKRLTVVNVLLSGVSTVGFMNVPNLWVSFALWFLGSLNAGLWISVSRSLAIEQVPDYRGTMMSLNEVSRNVGRAIGIALGGAILVFYDYAVSSLLGISGIVGAIILHFFTQDPTRSQHIAQELRGGER